MASNKTSTVRQRQRTLYRKAKQDQAVQFSRLYDKVWREDVLWEAWQQVKAHHGAPGVDGVTIEAMGDQGQEAAMIGRLAAQLRAKTYRFQPVRRVDIPKPKGGTRPLGIAVVEDRVVQTAMQLVLEPIFEADFHDCSSGYRPHRDAKMASEPLRADLARGAWAVVEIAFQSYFLTMPHGKLLRLSRQRVRDGRMLWLIKHSLKAGGLSQGQITPTTAGVPQGAPIAPLYSNISLNLLEQVWHSRGYPTTLGASLPRYADDAILICRRHAEQALHAFEAMVARMDLIINRPKTRITKGTEGCDYLGFHFVRRRSPPSGKRPISIFPSQAAQRSIRRRIKYCTKRRAPGPPEAFVRQINEAVEGWGNDYRPTKASQAFRALQRFITTRFRRYLTSRRKGRGCGWKQAPNRRLYAMGITPIGSGQMRYPSAPAHAL
jgi:RNA-directed DNA polymerase